MQDCLTNCQELFFPADKGRKRPWEKLMERRGSKDQPRRLGSSLRRSALWIGVLAMLATVIVPLVGLDRSPRLSLEVRSATLENSCYRHSPAERGFARG